MRNAGGRAAVLRDRDRSPAIHVLRCECALSAAAQAGSAVGMRRRCCCRQLLAKCASECRERSADACCTLLYLFESLALTSFPSLMRYVWLRLAPESGAAIGTCVGR